MPRRSLILGVCCIVTLLAIFSARSDKGSDETGRIHDKLNAAADQTKASDQAFWSHAKSAVDYVASKSTQTVKGTVNNIVQRARTFGESLSEKFGTISYEEASGIEGGAEGATSPNFNAAIQPGETDTADAGNSKSKKRSNLNVKHSKHFTDLPEKQLLEEVHVRVPKGGLNQIPNVDLNSLPQNMRESMQRPKSMKTLALEKKLDHPTALAGLNHEQKELFRKLKNELSMLHGDPFYQPQTRNTYMNNEEYRSRVLENMNQKRKQLLTDLMLEIDNLKVRAQTEKENKTMRRDELQDKRRRAEL